MKITYLQKIIFLKIFTFCLFLNTSMVFALQEGKDIEMPQNEFPTKIDCKELNHKVSIPLETPTVCDTVYGVEKCSNDFYSFKYNAHEILAKPDNCILYLGHQEIYCENPIRIENDMIILNPNLKFFLDNNLPTAKVYRIQRGILIDKISNHSKIHVRNTMEGKTIRAYSTGTPVRILEKSSHSWVKIMLPDFSIGYVRELFLSAENVSTNNDIIKIDIIKQNSDGFYLFTYDNNQFLAHPDHAILYINNVEFYCENPIFIENTTIILNSDLRNYLDHRTPTSKVHPIIQGELINQVTENNCVNIHDAIDGKISKTYRAKTKVNVLYQSFDGWLQIMLPDGFIGYIDGRYLRLKEDVSLPPVDIQSFMHKEIKRDYILIVNQQNQNLQIYKKLNNQTYTLDTSSKVSTGLFKTPTPNGWFTLKSKRGSWMYIPKFNVGIESYSSFKGSYLLHGVPANKNKQPLRASINKLGRKASHGCIRLPIHIAKNIYDNVETGSVIIIDATPPLIEDILSSFNQLEQI
ncbi:L,D-transpeptidase family protein [Marinisporobacter balticus]|uniref:L,D-transpeptidase-like protein n=1 Tax=Marinisporobacter balticus TaxID=2018667 RepID=A0A4R2KQI0_9FIRM|nr:L,D-transpeptidase family protein [Marinisporobacter balticus]TCO74937.1 L,D-transpeptidase-like protein [Marinisporobacter balticus]